MVDDSAIIRARLVEILSALEGVEHVDTAARASEARNTNQAARPDVVVLDIHMPGGSGMEVLESLRSGDQRIMTIVLTNDPAPQWRAASLQAGADFFFDKSAEFQQAVDVIARLALGRATPSGPPPQPLPGGAEMARQPEDLTGANARLRTRIDELEREILERKQAGSAERNQATEALRTAEERLQQSQKMDAIGQLAGGVAHDFSNLLCVILGFCELLMADLNLNDPRQADIAEIHKAGTLAATLTRQLLAFSRKEIIEPTLLDLNVVVAEMLPMLERLIGEDVKVVLRLGPDQAPVKADRGQVEQVVMNLALNARDAMPAGGTLSIEIATGEIDEHQATTSVIGKPGPYVALTVTDTGTGMTPQVKARLFEPFFTTKASGRGTGLGLATVHGIVTRSGGSVYVSSKVGRGTSFEVYFPLASAVGMAADAPPPATQRRAGGQTVLLVDDAAALREVTKRLLKRLGYRVLVAASADEARQLFQENPSIDVLLTDVVMPGASGPELTTELVEQRPALKVIYMSGHTEATVVEQGIVKPGIAFLHKPFTSETLERKLREALDR